MLNLDGYLNILLYSIVLKVGVALMSINRLEDTISKIKVGGAQLTTPEYIEMIKPVIDYQVSFILNQGLVKDKPEVIVQLVQTLAKMYEKVNKMD